MLLDQQSRLNARSRERAPLLAAFIDLVGSRGYDGGEPSGVARQAGLEPSAFAAHFVDRRACFLAAGDGLEAAYWRQLTAYFRDSADRLARLSAGLSTTFELVEAHPAAARFMTIATHCAPVPEHLRQRPLAARLEELLRREPDELRYEHSRPSAGWLLAVMYDRLYRHLCAGTEVRLAGRGAGDPVSGDQRLRVKESTMPDPDLPTWADGQRRRGQLPTRRCL